MKKTLILTGGLMALPLVGFTAELVTSAPWQSWTKPWTYRADDADVAQGGWATLRFTAGWTGLVHAKGRENYAWSGVVVSVKAKGRDGETLFLLTKNLGVGTKGEADYSFRFLVPRESTDFRVFIGPQQADGAFSMRAPALSLAPLDARYPTLEHKGKFYEYDERGAAPTDPAGPPADGLAFFRINAPRLTFDRFAPEKAQLTSGDRPLEVFAAPGETANVFIGLFAGRDLDLAAAPTAFTRRKLFGLLADTLAATATVFRAHNRPNSAGRGQTYWIAPQVLLPFETCGKVPRGTTAQAVVQFHVPADAAPGVYDGAVVFSDGDVRKSAAVRLTVRPVRIPFPDAQDYETILHVGWYGDDPKVLQAVAADAKRRGCESLLIACQYGNGRLKLREADGRLEIVSFDRFDHARAAFTAAGMRGTLYVHFSDKLEVAVAHAIGADLPDGPGEQTHVTADMETPRFKAAQVEALRLLKARAGADVKLAILAMDEPDGRGREPRCRYEIARIREAGLTAALYGGGPSYALMHPDVLITQTTPGSAAYATLAADARAHGARICRYGGSGSYGFAFGGLMPSRLLHGWGEYLMPESRGHTIWLVQTDRPYAPDAHDQLASFGSVYERTADGRLLTTLELEGCYAGICDYAYLKELERRLAAHAGEARALRIAAEFAALKRKMREVVPYRLDADTVVDYEKEMKKPFTNADAEAVREVVARWIDELD